MKAIIHKFLLLNIIYECLGTRIQINSFTPSPIHDTFTTSPSINQFSTNFNNGDSIDIKSINSFMQRECGLNQDDYIIKSFYTSSHNKLTHIYLRQTVDNYEVVNGDMNINVAPDNTIASIGNSFYKAPLVSESTKSLFDQSIQIPIKFKLTSLHKSFKKFNPEYLHGNVDIPSAMGYLNRYLNVDFNWKVATLHHITQFNKPDHWIISNLTNNQKDIIIKKNLIQTNEGALELIWDIELDLDDNWFNAHVSTVNGNVHSLIDWVSDASYNVYPINTNDPYEGDRKTVIDPSNSDASPLGWHNQGTTKLYDTAGNNVYAHENHESKSDWESISRPKGGESNDYNYDIDLSKEPKEYVDGAVVNLFYWNNIIHDLYYVYGFDEAAGNFQENNFDKGGDGGDAVNANAQDGGGTNNANFATPPDGKRSRMRMYIWNLDSPNRDGDIENGIIIHEYSHGLSIRLTGGRENSNCLSFGESGGMGEGWGDFISIIIRLKASDNRDKDVGMGNYVYNNKTIRPYVYSTNKQTNPQEYATLNEPSYNRVHAIGSVWATILYEVYWNLVEKLGFSEDLFSKSTNHGNTLLLQLIIDGMKIQKCRPGFIEARDAILKAEEILTHKENYCTIYRGFAKGGLGCDAKFVVTSPWGTGERFNGFEVPDECK